MDQVAFLSSNNGTTAFAPPEPSSVWKTHRGLHRPQKRPASTASCSTGSGLAAFELEDAFCSPQDPSDLIPNVEAPRRLVDSAADASQEEDVQRNVDATAPLQERIRYVMEMSAAAGFATLDDAVASYYTEIFENTSPLYQDQRLSRNRQLPRLLSILNNAAKD